MRRVLPWATLFYAGAALALAKCGDGNQQQGDAATEADTNSDAIVTDSWVSDTGTVSDGSDASDAAFPYPPAFWSLRYEHAGYGDLGDNLYGPLCAAVQATAGADFGVGALDAAATVSVALNYVDGGPGYAPLSQTIAAYPNTVITGDVTFNGTSQYHELALRDVVKRKLLTAYACSKTYAGAAPVSYATYGTNVAPSRYHHTLNKGDVKALDGLNAGLQDTPVLTQLVPGELLVEFGAANTNYIMRLSDASSYAVAVDAVSAAAPSTVIVVAGRMAGPFDFGSGPVSGDGYFIVGLNPSDLSVAWTKVLGGTPIQSVSAGATAAEGTSIRIVGASQPAFVVTVPFSGTLNLGNTQLVGPAQGEATAVFGMDTAGNVTWSKAFKKGPASAGKLSRPSVMTYVVQSTLHYRLFDTVWDSIDFGGQVVQANAGADVVVADLDDQGNLLSTRVYGGPGDDEAYRIRGSTLNDCLVVGHSAKSIDFGNGALATTANEGETWVARLP